MCQEFVSVSVRGCLVFSNRARNDQEFIYFIYLFNYLFQRFTVHINGYRQSQENKNSSTDGKLRYNSRVPEKKIRIEERKVRTEERKVKTEKRKIETEERKIRHTMTLIIIKLIIITKLIK